MDTIVMNWKNRKTSKPHVLILNLTDKLDLRRGENSIVLSSLSTYCTWKNIKTSYNNNNFKMPTPTWNNRLELPDGSYSVPDIQENIDNPRIRIYVNKIKNRITFRLKMDTVLTFQHLNNEIIWKHRK